MHFLTTDKRPCKKGIIFFCKTTDRYKRNFVETLIVQGDILCDIFPYWNKSIIIKLYLYTKHRLLKAWEELQLLQIQHFNLSS